MQASGFQKVVQLNLQFEHRTGAYASLVDSWSTVDVFVSCKCVYCAKVQISPNHGHASVFAFLFLWSFSVIFHANTQ